jgi:hypothetical protein
VKQFMARANVLAPASAPPHVNWQQSAAAFATVVLEGKWYRHYRPEAALAPPPDRSAATPSSQSVACRIELVEGPIPMDRLGRLKVIVRVTNLGGFVWSDAAGIALGYRLLDRNGRPIGRPTRRVRIPLVQVPGEAHYMSITLPKYGLRRPAGAADIALFVRENGLWESALRVSLEGG